MPSSLSERLGTFVADTSGLPPDMAHAGKRALLNGVGLALNAATDPALDSAMRAMIAFGSAGECHVIGRSERLDPAGAAFVNAIGMNLLDFDDTHLPTIIHPTAPVAPVALALGEARGSSGRDVLAAFVLGAEIACRVGDLVSPGHYARGWHVTSTCGAFGAAAAAAKLLGLDAAGVANALGLASSLASGTVENLTTAGKNASVGNAARNGILAALLAEAGYEAAPLAIEGRLGWARASGDEPDLDRALVGLGRDWAFALNAIKPYPAGIVFHSVIDACLDLRAAHGLEAPDIAEVVIRGDELLLTRGNRPVLTHRDARVSLHHAAAAVFLHGGADIAEFEAPRVMAPEAVAFRALVRGELDPNLPSGAASVRVRLRDGREVETTVLHARGSIERPMSDREVEAKARGLASKCTELDDLVARIWRIDDEGDMATLLHKATQSS